MAEPRLRYEQRKGILKWKTEKVNEMQRRWRNEFVTPPPTHVKIARLRDKSETDGTMQNVNKERPGRPRILTDDISVETVWKSVRQCSHENTILILRCEK
jgi:hypothetical protein